MKKYILLSFALISIIFDGMAQEKTISLKKKSFVNQTEFAVLLGRSRENIYYYYYDIYPGYGPNYPASEDYSMRNVAALSLQTFNGFYLNKKLAVGITTGIDSYSDFLIIPILAGARYQLAEKSVDGSKFIAGLDAGFGTPVLASKNQYTTYNGGLTLNPSVGFKFPTKSGSSWLINFGYKYQYATIDTNYGEENFGTESRNYKRLQVRLGFEF
jgi:hypothetical protein